MIPYNLHITISLIDISVEAMVASGAAVAATAVRETRNEADLEIEDVAAVGRKIGGRAAIVNAARVVTEVV